MSALLDRASEVLRNLPESMEETAARAFRGFRRSFLLPLNPLDEQL